MWQQAFSTTIMVNVNTRPTRRILVISSIFPRQVRRKCHASHFCPAFLNKFGQSRPRGPSRFGHYDFLWRNNFCWTYFDYSRMFASPKLYKSKFRNSGIRKFWNISSALAAQKTLVLTPEHRVVVVKTWSECAKLSTLHVNIMLKSNKLETSRRVLFKK